MSAPNRLALIVAVVAATAALPSPWSDVSAGLVVFLAITVSVSSVRQLRGSVGWRRLTQGAVLIGFAPVVSELHTLAQPDVGPIDLGDVVLAGGYILFLVGIRGVLTARTMARQTRSIGDALLGTLWLAFASLAWAAPRLTHRLDGYPLLASLMFLPLSLALVFLVMQLMFGSSTRSGSVTYLAFGVGSTAISELGFLAVAAGHPEFRRIGVASATAGIVLLAAAIDHPSAKELESPIAGQQAPLGLVRTIYLVGSFLIVGVALVAYPRPRPALALPLSAIALVTSSNLFLTVRERERLIIRERALRQSIADIMRAREPDQILQLGSRAIDKLLANRPYLESDFLRWTGTEWVTVPENVPARLDTGALEPLSDPASWHESIHRLELRSDLPGISYVTRIFIVADAAKHYIDSLFVEASPVLTTTEIEQIQQIYSTVERALIAFDLGERAHIRRAEQRFRLLVQDSGDVVALLDPVTKLITMISPSSQRILGYSEDQMVGSELPFHFHPDDQHIILALTRDSLVRTQDAPVDVRIQHRDGHYHWLAATIREHLSEPDINALVVSLRDIHDRKMAELSLTISEQQFRGLVLSSRDMFLTLESDFTIGYISPNVVRLLGFNGADLIASNIAAILTDLSSQRLSEVLAEQHGVLHQEVVELEFLTNLRQIRQAEVTLSARSDGCDGGWSMTVSDVTEQRRLEEDLRAQALYDGLTGLPNRSTLHFELQQCLQRLGPGHHLGLYLLDIKDFKSINQSVGYDAGNDVLVTVATRLRASLRGGDILARIGGNEFAVIVISEHRYELVDVAERLARLFDQPTPIAGREQRLTVSVGYDITADRWAVAQELMNNASVAIGAGRRDGVSEACRFEPIMKVTVTDRFELTADLIGAIGRNELSVVYQPIVELASQRVRGVEALLRWSHPERGPVSPAVFIPLAERSGLITDLGRWVLGRACHQLQYWHRHVEGAEHLTMSVNVSARQLEHPGEAAHLGRLVDESGVAASSITIELTESTLLDDPAWIRSQLDLLREQGMRVAIDDFGTGAAGLAHLRDVPFNVIKIDKSYVDALRQSKEAELLVRGVIELAHRLGAETVAEGIEDPREFDLLRSLGCKLGQGFYMARPMDPVALELWFARGRTGAVPALIAEG